MATLFDEYGDILKVRLFAPESQLLNQEKSLSAEILVADTEDSAFFVTTFDQMEFAGRTLTLRHKNHNFQVTDVIASNQESIVVKWNTWKSKLTVNHTPYL